MSVRKPAVAGLFYEGTREGLIRQIEWAIKHPLGPGRLERKKEEDVNAVIAVVSPHAGYIYSGPIAAMAFAEIYKYENPKTFIIIGPNHHGIGAPIAIYPRGYWETPLGTVEVDEEIVEELVKKVPYLEKDPTAFIQEHSLEVQLPFIQYIFGNDVKIVPVVLMRQTKEVARDLGSAIADIIASRGPGNVVLVASSDWNHYEPHEVTVNKDMRAIDPVLRLDLDGFYEAIQRYDVSVCGFGAIGTAIETARRLSAKKARLLKHATSGDTSGYTLETVGYAAIAFYI